MVLVASETGHVYTFATAKFQPLLNSKPGRKLIQTCLANDGDDPTDSQDDEMEKYDDEDEEDIQIEELEYLPQQFTHRPTVISQPDSEPSQYRVSSIPVILRSDQILQPK